MRYRCGPPHAFAPKAMIRHTDDDEHGESFANVAASAVSSFLGCLPAQPRIMPVTAAKAGISEVRRQFFLMSKGRREPEFGRSLRTALVP